MKRNPATAYRSHRSHRSHRSTSRLQMALRSLAATAVLSLGSVAIAQTPAPAEHGIVDHPPAVVEHDLQMLNGLVEGRPMMVEVETPAAAETPRVYGVELSSALIFPTDSADLSAQMMAQVEDAVFLMQRPEMAGWKVRLVGHADSTGSSAWNDALSLRRAEAAREYMVRRGVDPQRIQVIGGGELADDPMLRPAVSQALNRRVDLVVTPQ